MSDFEVGNKFQCRSEIFYVKILANNGAGQYPIVADVHAVKDDEFLIRTSLTKNGMSDLDTSCDVIGPYAEKRILKPGWYYTSHYQMLAFYGQVSEKGLPIVVCSNGSVQTIEPKYLSNYDGPFQDMAVSVKRTE